jgi:hypothetical protein
MGAHGLSERVVRPPRQPKPGAGLVDRMGETNDLACDFLAFVYGGVLAGRGPGSRAGVASLKGELYDLDQAPQDQTAPQAGQQKA